MKKYIFTALKMGLPYLDAPFEVIVSKTLKNTNCTSLFMKKYFLHNGTESSGGRYLFAKSKGFKPMSKAVLIRFGLFSKLLT